MKNIVIGVVIGIMGFYVVCQYVVGWPNNEDDTDYEAYDAGYSQALSVLGQMDGVYFEETYEDINGESLVSEYGEENTDKIVGAFNSAMTRILEDAARSNRPENYNPPQYDFE